MSRPICDGCRNGETFSHAFSMAFQPIVDVDANRVFAYEALARGSEGQPAYTVLSAVDDKNRYAFDQQCRVKAIDLAASLDLAREGVMLSINFLPNAVYEPKACIQLTLSAAKKSGFPLDRIIFEFTENEKVDAEHLDHILKVYKEMGFATAIDDFGAGYAGLTLLARFQPTIVKLDMDLVRNVDRERVRQVLVRSIVNACGDLGVRVLAEGMETRSSPLRLHSRARRCATACTPQTDIVEPVSATEKHLIRGKRKRASRDKAAFALE